jgi:hypothetical protein
MRSVALGLMLGTLSLGGVAFAQGSTKAPPPAPAAAPGCPCMQGGGMAGGPMMGQANVTVENTSSGAVVRFSAKDPAQVQRIQQHAQMMASCMGSRATPPK